MPKRKSKDDEDDDDDEYNPEGDDSPEEELLGVDDADDDSNNPEGEENHKGGQPDADENGEETTGDTKQKRRPKKLRRKIHYEDPEIDLLPSHERKTTAGGYAHTNKSKEKISMANRGNTPWNKGKNRSSADRAKIKAGVQARNRAIKLEKLRRLGMTEEEYDKKKKEIKYLRERVRRTKLANDRHAAAQAQKKLQAAIDATSDKVPVKELVKKIHEEADEEVVKIQKEIKVFSEEITWTPVEVWKEGDSYDKICPSGGPGGLICCQECAKKYSSFVDDTMKDLEAQRTHKLGNEVKEIATLLEQGRSDLERIGSVARRKPPPTNRRMFQSDHPRATSTSASKSRASLNSNQRLGEEDQEWNLTSTFDIVQPMGGTEVWGV
ncbi:unnamed protein product [Cylindrotheca closterium]|uniref:Nuclease associated modular domain-containing protein n=1 Tax=Cylindrotheca closterium TaxID=2856 RepID=A0AAD2GA70_9STRA|nr:unnamed protein product [Cylindrotheca closterium]